MRKSHDTITRMSLTNATASRPHVTPTATVCQRHKYNSNHIYSPGGHEPVLKLEFTQPGNPERRFSLFGDSER